MANSGRNDAVDAFRGLLILYIVLVIHGIFWLGLIPQKFASILLFEMPAIFLIIGYAFRLHQIQNQELFPQQNPHNYIQYVISRSARILVPYWLYAAACATYISVTQPSGTVDELKLFLDWLNPLANGKHHYKGMLNWHLWFIPVYLAVVVCLPFASRVPINTLGRLGVSIALLFLLLALATKIDVPGQQTMFYLAVALLGYHLPDLKERFSKKMLALIFLASVSALAMAAYASGSMSVLNMQANKFPPNPLFLLFSIMWISALALVCLSGNTLTAVGRLKNTFWLAPFVVAGYSIYLWQGMAYTLAASLKHRFELPTVLAVGCAFALTILFGLITYKLEQMRYKPALRPQSKPV